MNPAKYPDALTAQQNPGLFSGISAVFKFLTQHPAEAATVDIQQRLLSIMM